MSQNLSRGSDTLAEREVLDYAEALPRYQRPRVIHFGAVPRNATGKIEKPKLRRRYAPADA